MNRRQFLVASGTATAVGLAGCSALATETLTPTAEEEEERTVHLQYGDGDEYIATISFIDRWGDDSHERWFPLRLHLWKEDGLEAESIRYEFRDQFADHPPRYYLERPSGTWDPIQFSRTDDGQATLLEVPNLGFQGRGSVTMDILVENRNEEPVDIDISVDAKRRAEYRTPRTSSMQRAGYLLAGVLGAAGGGIVAVGMAQRETELASGGAVLLFAAAVVLVTVVVAAEMDS